MLCTFIHVHKWTFVLNILKQLQWKVFCVVESCPSPSSCRQNGSCLPHLAWKSEKWLSLILSAACSVSLFCLELFSLQYDYFHSCVWSFAPCTLACFVISEEKHNLDLMFDLGLEYGVHLFSDLGSDSELNCYNSFTQFCLWKAKTLCYL